MDDGIPRADWIRLRRAKARSLALRRRSARRVERDGLRIVDFRVRRAVAGVAGRDTGRRAVRSSHTFEGNAASAHRSCATGRRSRRGPALPRYRNSCRCDGDLAKGRRRAERRASARAHRRPPSGCERFGMLIHLKGGRIIDPANERDEISDLWIRDDRIVAAPLGGATADETVDAGGLIIMAGGIDIHSHIAGSNVDTARLLLPEQPRSHARRADATPLSNAGWATFETGCLYAEMWFTTVVEPAVSPQYALQAHLELADIPIIDKAILAILGNDDFLLGLMRSGEDASVIRDYVAWTLHSTRALGVKVINAGGVAAFKENVRSF